MKSTSDEASTERDADQLLMCDFGGAHAWLMVIPVGSRGSHLYLTLPWRQLPRRMSKQRWSSGSRPTWGFASSTRAPSGRDRDPIAARGLLAQRVARHGAQPPDTAEQLVLVPVRIRQAKVAAMRAHAAALRPCRDLRNSTAEQPSNRGLKRFQYPVVVRGSSPVEIEANDSKVLEVLTPESEHWRGLQLDPNHRLLIRRSLVRAQVGEPIKSKGYVARRNPFLFAILDSDPGCPISSTSPRSYLFTGWQGSNPTTRSVLEDWRRRDRDCLPEVRGHGRRRAGPLCRAVDEFEAGYPASAVGQSR